MQARESYNTHTQEVLDSIVFCVDVQNLFYSARDAYGLAARVDFRKLKELAFNERSFRHIVSIAYLAAMPNEIPESFTQALSKMAYDVRMSKIRVHERGQLSATNIDVRLASDVQNIKILGKDPSVVVVASGDADYIPVYQVLKSRGIRVEVLSFQSSLATPIYNEVDAVRFVTRDHLYGERIFDE